MALYTSSYLKNLSRTATENVRLYADSNKSRTSFDIFLCHSYLDKDEVEGLYLELTRMGYSVYIDWIIDPYLDRKNITKESAELIRKRLRSSKTLLLALSTNAEISAWVPWELGYVDGHTHQCALIPVSQDNITRASFDTKEYLKLYPYIEKPNNLSLFSNNLWAVDGANTYVGFRDWVQGKEPKYGIYSFY